MNQTAVPPRWGQPIQPDPSGAIEAWLDSCEANLTHPAKVEDQLRRQGWSQPASRCPVPLPGPARLMSALFSRKMFDYA